MRAIITAEVRILIIFVFLEFLVEILKNLYIIGDTISHPGENIFIFVAILISVCLIIFFVFFVAWLKADWLARMLAGGLPENSLVFYSTNLELFRVATKILGLCLLATTIPTIAGLIAYQIVMTKPDPVYSSVSEQAITIRSWVIPIVKIIIGIWLVMGFRGTITAISKIWNTARMTNEDEYPPKNDVKNTLADIDQDEEISNNNTEDALQNSDKKEDLPH